LHIRNNLYIDLDFFLKGAKPAPSGLSKKKQFCRDNVKHKDFMRQNFLDNPYPIPAILGEWRKLQSQNTSLGEMSLFG